MITRSTSRMQAQSENNMATTSAVVTSGTYTPTTGTVTNINANTIPAGITSEAAILPGNEVSVSSGSMDPTLISPIFGSQTAQNIQQEARETNVFSRATYSRPQVSEHTPPYGQPPPLEPAPHQFNANNGAASSQQQYYSQQLYSSPLQQHVESTVNQRQSMLQQPQRQMPPQPTAPNPPFSQPYPLQQQHQTVQQPYVPPQQLAPSQQLGLPPQQNYLLPQQPYPQHQQICHPTQVYRNFQSGYPNNGGSVPMSIPPQIDRCRLEKWGVKFDGTSKTLNVQEFIFRVGALKEDYCCSDQEFLRSFHLLLDGPALDWFWTYRRSERSNSWENLQMALLSQYRQYGQEHQIQMQILNRRQLPQESVDDYINAVVKLRNQQLRPYDEEQMVEIMRGNLRPLIAQMMFAVQTRSMAEFCREARRAESVVNGQRQMYQQRSSYAPRVSEMFWPEEDLTTMEFGTSH